MKKAINRLSLGLSRFSGLALVVLMVTMVADAVGRKLVGTLPGAYETAMALMVLVMFLPQGHAEMNRSHVAVDILTSRFPKKTQAVISFFSALLGIAVFGLLTYLGWGQAWRSTLEQEMWPGFIEYPFWPFRWGVPLGAGVLTLELFNTAIHEFRRAFGRE
jgi:TRAP-type C4-dicarboxylate transport system permease small subunit